MEVFIDSNVTNVTDSLIVYRDTNYEQKKENSIPYYDLDEKPHHAFLESFQYIMVKGYSIYASTPTPGGTRTIHVIFTDRGIFSCDYTYYINRLVNPIIVQSIDSISNDEYIKSLSGHFADVNNKNNYCIQLCTTNRNNIYWIRSNFTNVSDNLYKANQMIRGHISLSANWPRDLTLLS
jgi:hypothetical protein